MSILGRMKYAMYVLIAVTMIVMLTLSIAEGLGALHGFDIQGLMANPYFFVPVFVAGVVVAPFVSERMPTSGDGGVTEEERKRSVGYAARMLLLVVGGMSLVIFATLIVFVFGRIA
jgi:hypothetical protein